MKRKNYHCPECGKSDGMEAILVCKFNPITNKFEALLQEYDWNCTNCGFYDSWAKAVEKKAKKIKPKQKRDFVEATPNNQFEDILERLTGSYDMPELSAGQEKELSEKLNAELENIAAQVWDYSAANGVKGQPNARAN